MVYDPFDPYLYGGFQKRRRRSEGGGTENERFRRRETAEKLENEKINSRRAEKNEV